MRVGFPIQKSPGHSLFADSPKHIAGYHVFHRLSMPRHPPHTLSNLTTIIDHRRPALTPHSVIGKLLRFRNDSSGPLIPGRGKRLLSAFGAPSRSTKVFIYHRKGARRVPIPLTGRSRTRHLDHATKSFLSNFPVGRQNLVPHHSLVKEHVGLSADVPREADWEVVVTANRSISGRFASPLSSVTRSPVVVSGSGSDILTSRIRLSSCRERFCS